MTFAKQFELIVRTARWTFYLTRLMPGVTFDDAYYSMRVWLEDEIAELNEQFGRKLV